MLKLFTSLCLVLAMAVPAISRADRSDPIVKTTAGSVRGQPSKGAISFLGVPYGAPTGGKARFLPPEKVSAWQGVRDANHLGVRCPQPDVASYAPAETRRVLAYAFSSEPTSEDCLNVNVWTPAADGKKRPVFVWFHGGGFWLGSGSDPGYEGSNLAARNDIVVVAVNARLGIWGYLTLGPEAGPRYASSGMAGMEDLVLALRWVHDNIAAFGGDPGNVTIGGQSGGGSKTTTLLGMPAAQGLFHKAIIMSGAAVKAQSKENALKTGEKILQALNLTSKDIDKLQALPLADLDKVNTKFGLFSFFPSVDGRVLAASPFDPNASDLSKNVPILVGTTKDEAAPLTVNDPNWKPTSEEQMLKNATTALGGEDLAKKAIAFYRAQDPQATPHQISVAISTDNTFWLSSVKLAERRAVQPGGAPVYMYRFHWASPVLANTAPHAVELPLLFDNPDVGVGMVGDGPTVQPMANVMSRSFVAFMRTGNPGTSAMPKWPAYSIENRDTMIFDNKLAVMQDPNKEKRLFWKENRP